MPVGSALTPAEIADLDDVFDEMDAINAEADELDRAAKKLAKKMQGPPARKAGLPRTV